MKPLRVLSVAYPLAPVRPDTAGGAEQVLGMLDAALVKSGHSSVVIAAEGSRTVGRLVEIPLPKEPFDEAARRAAQAGVRRALAGTLANGRFDVVHLHGLDFHEYLPPPGIRVLATLHLPPAWYAAEALRPSRPRTWLQCVSASQQRTCAEGVPLVPYIENGVPVEEFRTSVRRRGYVTVMGRVCPEKGFHLALDAAARAGVPAVAAGAVFGYPEHREYFERQVRPRLDARRRFVGPAGPARKRRLLAGARCLLVPSLAAETSSLVAMEALACGTPVVAFPAGALAEIVEHGRTGFLVRDAGEMAAAIGEVGKIDAAECRRVARERFSAGRMTCEYLGLYERLAGGSAGFGRGDGDNGGRVARAMG
jgi:glycosyltransferase involved in cell wall biosynthesis